MKKTFLICLISLGIFFLLSCSSLGSDQSSGLPVCEVSSIVHEGESCEFTFSNAMINGGEISLATFSVNDGLACLYASLDICAGEAIKAGFHAEKQTDGSWKIIALR